MENRGNLFNNKRRLIAMGSNITNSNLLIFFLYQMRGFVGTGAYLMAKTGRWTYRLLLPNSSFILLDLSKASHLRSFS